MIKKTLLSSAIVSAIYFPAALAASPVKSVEFTSMPAPVSEQELKTAYTKSSALITYANGTVKTFPLSYEALYGSGDGFGNWKAGAVADRSGEPLASAVVDEKGTAVQGPFYARSPDANSLIKVGGGLYLVTHFEYDTEAPNAVNGQPMVELYSRLPMAMNLARLAQNRKSGELSVKSLANVDMSAVDGLWIPCAGELTPWNTHIGGEEYEPDARTYESRPLTAMNLYLGTPGKTAAAGGASPYRYGYATEVSLDARGGTRVQKHYAMGRLSNELAHIVADGRTVYKGDDGRDTILTMFVADRRGDLSAGNLYAAQLKQLDAANGGSFTLRWIHLGHATDKEVKALVDKGIRFSDIFDVAGKVDYANDRSAYAGFKPVLVYTGTDGTNSGKLEYLRVKPGMDKAAAFLETRRYAALRGATTEFTKMEGETSNRRDRKLYVAMSYVERGMLAGKNQDRPRDDIALEGDPEDLKCGVIYESNLRGRQRDTAGRPIKSQWVAVDMRALLLGTNKPKDQTAYGKYDKCDTDRIANPDNIKFSNSMRTLFVGEDSAHHFNNFLWAYSVDTGKLARIASGRFGAEWTGLQAVDDLNGFAYILGNQQHPGATEDTAQYREVLRKDGIALEEFRADVDTRGAVGYLRGLPAIRRQK